ncbi:putative metal transport system membrane protein [Candidatus Clavichlamydia salmonicola]|uniref:metal ABC transporter permease n=1 Tax=Candidatus Clavichlamydia salmonicola TaxID=469812 RepID=UPI001E2E90B3|nr:metal ABC transporter permease [Candidatus Clavichlamydia salmonicola]MBF5051040.1 putative metal transport system membrane protein [Candidatus Clavichlamydia salmonicola]
MLLSLDPYGGVSFFSFFKVLFFRLPLLFSFNMDQIVSDEIQLIVLTLTSISGALVGSFLLLKKMTMFTDALSHTVLLGLVTVFLFSGQVIHLSIFQLTLAAIITSLLTGASIHFFTRKLMVYEEAAIGLTFTVMFALGLIILSGFSGGSHLGTEFITGNVDALILADINISAIICFVNLIFCISFFRLFWMTIFDVVSAKVRGLPIIMVDAILIFQTALTLVGTFKSVGIVMALGFFIMPGMIARIFVKSVIGLVLASITIGVVVSLVAIAISRWLFGVLGFGFSTGGICVLLLSLTYMLALLFSYKKSILSCIFRFNRQKYSGIDNSSKSL